MQDSMKHYFLSLLITGAVLFSANSLFAQGDVLAPSGGGGFSNGHLRALLSNQSAMAGQRGYATFTVTSGSVAVLGLRFNGSAFTSIPANAN